MKIVVTGIFLVKPQLLEKRRLKTVVRLLEEEGFQILDMCMLRIKASEFEAFMKSINQAYESVEVTLLTQGRSALFAVSHKSIHYLVNAARVERASKAQFYEGDIAVETWFGKLQN
jgi:nucleoside diphosphate kinase